MPEVDVGLVTELPEGRGRCIEHGVYSLAVFRRGDAVFALDNACPHRGGPLCEGDVREGIVYCPLHAWGFDLGTGVAVNVRNSRAETFPTRVEGGRAIVVLPERDGGSDDRYDFAD